MSKKGKGIRGVLITTYLFTMGIAMLIGFGIFRQIETKSMSRKAYVTAVENGQTFSKLIDLFLDKTIYISVEVTINENVQQVLCENKRLSEIAISKILDEYLVNNTHIQSIHIVDRHNKVVSQYSSPPYKKNNVPFLSQVNIEKINEMQGAEYIGIGKNAMAGEEENTLYIGRAIYSKKDLENIGYLIIYLDPAAIRSSAEAFLKQNKMQILIEDEEQHIFSFSESSELEEAYNGSLNGSKHGDFVELDEPRFNLKIIGEYTNEMDYEHILNIGIVICLINFIFLCIIIFVLRRVVVGPLEKIAQKARYITEEADLNVRFETNNIYVEAGLIGEALNEMLNKVTSLIEEVEERERIQRILELSVINHQVNPHFLYNSLNTVGVLIAIEDKSTAQKLIQSLSRYYRACLNQEDINTIEQELAITKEYVNIMLLKNPDLLTISYDIDEQLMQQKLPRMILQTLIENSIKYGIKTMEEPLKIKISIKEDVSKRRMILIVEDNGKGMENEVRENILKEKRLHNKSGFGLRSIIKRISLMYEMPKREDIFEIETKKDEYTRIIIYVPLSIYTT